MKLLHRFFATIVISTLPVTANAIPISYDFTLTTSNGLSVVGDFTANNDNPEDDWIRTAELIELNYVLNNGSTVVGTVTGLNATTAAGNRFNFNYNLLSGSFAQAGHAWNGAGNTWGGPQVAGGPLILHYGELIYLNPGNATRHLRGNIATNTGQATAVPSPPPIALLGAGLLALGCTRKKLRRNATLHS